MKVKVGWIHGRAVKIQGERLKTYALKTSQIMDGVSEQSLSDTGSGDYVWLTKSEAKKLAESLMKFAKS